MSLWQKIVIGAASGAIIVGLKLRGAAIFFDAGKAFSKMLISRFGDVLGNRVEDLVEWIIDLLQSFEDGMNSDDVKAERRAKRKGMTGKQIAEAKKKRRTG